MEIVILTALGVGGATILGAVVGFLFKGQSQRFENPVLAFSAGVMLAAAVWGLIIPSLESGKLSVVMAGILAGAVCMDLLGRLVCALRPENEDRNRVLLFVAAIAIHNLPEGIAAGVGFGTGNTAGALMIAGGIALQNIPEGMVIIAPMLSSGIRPRRTFLYALSTGLIEVFGTLLGYFTIRATSTLLPFALAFAGGTMLFIICGEMIPQTCCGSRSDGSYPLLIGFCLMVAFSVLI